MFQDEEIPRVKAWNPTERVGKDSQFTNTNEYISRKNAAKNKSEKVSRHHMKEGLYAILKLFYFILFSLGIVKVLKASMHGSDFIRHTSLWLQCRNWSRERPQSGKSVRTLLH